jgi:hypothetical protein
MVTPPSSIRPTHLHQASALPISLLSIHFSHCQFARNRNPDQTNTPHRRLRRPAPPTAISAPASPRRRSSSPPLSRLRPSAPRGACQVSTALPSPLVLLPPLSSRGDLPVALPLHFSAPAPSACRHGYAGSYDLLPVPIRSPLGRL